MAEMDRVELLIGLANNQRRDNQEWRDQVWREGQERLKALRTTIQRFEKEYGALHQELDLLKQYDPQPQEPMPRAVTQGPRNPNEPIQRKVNS